MSQLSCLDAQELLHLGMHAVGKDDPLQALECLKRCLDLDPKSAPAAYMLGALYAQIGLYDRAKDALTRAVELNPTEHTAVFQLGLLHLTSGQVEQAQAAWLHLDALPADHFLNLFRFGLLALAQDDFPRCVEHLERGISANTLNEPLNEDMRKVQAAARNAEAGAVRTSPTLPDRTAVHSAHHFLERYRQQNPR